MKTVKRKTVQNKLECDLSIIQFSNKCTAANLFKLPGEVLHQNDRVEYYKYLDDLASTETPKYNWRRVLSSYYTPTTPILYNDKFYSSQEHAINSFKFRKFNTEFAEEFCMFSCSDVKKDYEKDAAWAKWAGSIKGRYVKGGKVIYSRPKKIKPDHVIDSDEDPEKLAQETSRILEDVMWSKYHRNDYAKEILLATGYSVLYDKDEKRIAIELMNVRERLRNDELTS